MTRPHVTLKLATSLDGRIAVASGESRWITGPEARAEVQKLRRDVNAIMIGAGTARADDPELLARTEPPPKRQPLRVVLDTGLSLAPQGRLFASLDRAKLLIIGGAGADPARRAALEAAGAETALATSAAGTVDAEAALALLAERGVGRVLVEGGGKLAASLILAGAIDRIEWMRAPIVLGEEGRAAIGPLMVQRVSEAPAWRRVAFRALGPDLWESYERV
ncbi:RibD family protein [Terricaulis sp.]|uniref:RibD family protein n=1 Tax=Terricaulis sp. TaxID=2768686 RepID=UPI0037835AE2